MKVNIIMKNKLLIVEDNHDMVQFLSSLLRDRYEVHASYNGREALDKIEEISPDLILSDIIMPVMDGFELIENIRKDNKTMPIILLTARADSHDRRLGLGKGANDYIIKPFTREELYARISVQLEFRCSVIDHPLITKEKINRK